MYLSEETTPRMVFRVSDRTRWPRISHFLCRHRRNFSRKLYPALSVPFPGNQYRGNGRSAACETTETSRMMRPRVVEVAGYMVRGGYLKALESGPGLVMRSNCLVVEVEAVNTEGRSDPCGYRLFLMFGHQVHNDMS